MPTAANSPDYIGKSLNRKTRGLGVRWELTWDGSRYRGRWADRSTRMALKGALIMPGLFPFGYAAVLLLIVYLT